MRTPEQLARLIQAERFLRTLPVDGPCRWNFLTFGTKCEGCGTSACAAGHLGLAFGVEWGYPVEWFEESLHPTVVEDGVLNRCCWFEWAWWVFGMNSSDFFAIFGNLRTNEVVLPRHIADAMLNIIRRDHPDAYVREYATDDELDLARACLDVEREQAARDMECVRCRSPRT